METKGFLQSGCIDFGAAPISLSHFRLLLFFRLNICLNFSLPMRFIEIEVGDIRVPMIKPISLLYQN